MQASVAAAIQQADAEIKILGARAPEEMTFQNTIRAIDDLLYPVVSTLNRIYLIQNVSTDAALRTEASNQVVAVQNWLIGVSYRDELFRAVRTFRELNPELKTRSDLTSEDLKYFEDTWIGFKRAGMLIESYKTRKNIQKIKQRLAVLETKFSDNIQYDKSIVAFTDEELAGVPEDSIQEFAVIEGKRQVNASIQPEYQIVAQNAKNEETRKKIEIARQSIAQTKNQKLLSDILALRNQSAVALGYASHADYQIETRMAKTGKTAQDFLIKLKEGLEPRFKVEVEALRALKAKETGNTNPDFNLWDWRYYQNQLMKEKFTVDTEQLRVFFEISKVTRGVFDLYEEIFGLKIEKAEAPYKWEESVDLYSVKEKVDGRVLGYFYLDNFPRDGKFNHFAQFGIIDGKLRADGTYVKPVVALVCNFPKATADKPALMRHSDVETFFHEFGHGMHSILTRARYFTFSGTSVERDFVESPSQTLEAWAWDLDVLDRFAADYRNPEVKIDPDLVARMTEAKKATAGATYRRQLVFGLVDLELHMGGDKKDAAAIGQKFFSEGFFPLPAGADFTAGFGHLMGYDAGYYGYAWADAISEDLLTEFRNAPMGLFDTDVGMKLRREIYEVGGGRKAEDSVRVFLGREWSIQPFLKNLGIGN